MTELICPSVDACKQFGIRRNGAASGDNTSPDYKFLKGPQFKGVKVENYSGGKAEGIIDEVILEFIGNKPITMKPKQDGDIVKMEIDPKETNEVLYTVKIAPKDTDWLSFNFSHEWSEGDGIMSKILDTVTGLLDSASGIINTGQNLKAAAGDSSSQPRRKITLDKQDTYQKTDKVSFKIPFLLFSSGRGSQENPVAQWVKDVYEPLMIMNALSHPKRVTGVVQFGEGDNATKVDTADPNSGQKVADAQRQQSQTGDDMDKAQEKALQFLSSYPGMRVAISEPPSYVKVKHSSGFFEYNVCAITNFSYAFKGPWVKASSLVDGKIINADKKLMDVTLPMVAECSIEIKVIEKMYADDWISMFENSAIRKSAGAAADGIVNVYPKAKPAEQKTT